MVPTPPRLERRDETIHLTGTGMSREAVEQYVNPLIAQRVLTLGRQGWEPDGATDALSLWRQGRLSSRRHTSFWLDNHTYDPICVTLRVRRISTA